MADRPYMCRDEGLFLPECDDCSQLEGRVKALEDCCETATEELADHEERISSAESDIDTLQEDLMSAKSDIQSNTDAIDSIERLPEVTSADDGKVLTVVDGKWGIMPSSLVGEAIVGQSTVGEEETESDIDELKERMLSAESNIASLEENKQNKLTAGVGIQIQNDVISTTGSGDEGKADYTRIDECNDIVSFQADAKGVPLKSLTATINPKQSGSGDPSPDNVRPISGWDSVSVTRSGKNLLRYPYDSSNANKTVNGVTFTVTNDGILTVTGTPTAGTSFTFSKNLIDASRLKAGDEIYISTGTNYDTKSYFRLLYKNPTPMEGITRIDVDVKKIVITDDMVTRGIWFELWIPSDNGSISITVKPMVSFSSDGIYEPYTGTTYHTDLPETVYGGSLDVVSGVLTVDRAYVSMDGATQYSQTGDYTLYRKPNNPFSNNTSGGNALSNITNNFGNIATGLQDTKIQFPTGGTGYIYASVPNGLDISSATAVYTLATPTTIQLTPKQVTTLLGENNVWADSGDVCLEYEHTQGVPTLKARRTTYTTTESSEDTFALTDYTASDILFVYVNGLMLVEGDEYTIVGTNVVLTTPITQAGTVVHIVALQARL